MHSIRWGATASQLMSRKRSCSLLQNRPLGSQGGYCPATEVLQRVDNSGRKRGCPTRLINADKLRATIVPPALGNSPNADLIVGDITTGALTIQTGGRVINSNEDGWSGFLFYPRRPGDRGQHFLHFLQWSSREVDPQTPS